MLTNLLTCELKDYIQMSKNLLDQFSKLWSSVDRES
jgi:hypothetical protein